MAVRGQQEQQQFHEGKPPGDGSTAGSQNTDNAGAGAGGGDAGNGDAAGKDLIPRARLNEESKARRAAEAKLAELEAERVKEADAARKAKEATDAEQGRYRELAEARQTRIGELETQHTGASERLTRAEGMLRESLTARIERLPDPAKARLTARFGDDLTKADVFAVGEWLSDAEALIGSVGDGAAGAGAAGAGNGGAAAGASGSGDQNPGTRQAGAAPNPKSGGAAGNVDQEQRQRYAANQLRNV